MLEKEETTKKERKKRKKEIKQIRVIPESEVEILSVDNEWLLDENKLPEEKPPTSKKKSKRKTKREKKKEENLCVNFNFEEQELRGSGSKDKADKEDEEENKENAKKSVEDKTEVSNCPEDAGGILPPSLNSPLLFPITQPEHLPIIEEELKDSSTSEESYKIDPLSSESPHKTKNQSLITPPMPQNHKPPSSLIANQNGNNLNSKLTSSPPAFHSGQIEKKSSSSSHRKKINKIEHLKQGEELVICPKCSFHVIRVMKENFLKCNACGRYFCYMCKMRFAKEESKIYHYTNNFCVLNSDLPVKISVT